MTSTHTAHLAADCVVLPPCGPFMHLDGANGGGVLRVAVTDDARGRIEAGVLQCHESLNRKRFYDCPVRMCMCVCVCVCVCMCVCVMWFICRERIPW